LVVSFDNLAIEQLNLKRFFSEENWDKFYQGDDGSANLYIDLVEKQYALSSRSSERFPLTEKDTMKSIFEKIRSKYE
jgi:hypothetical protein